MAQSRLGRVLTPDKGGTGRTSLDAGSLLIGQGPDLPLRSLAPGPAGNVLRSDGTKWQSARGGQVIQVVNSVCTTQVTANSATWVHTGLNCSITPIKSDSSILVSIVQDGIGRIGTNDPNAFAYLQAIRSIPGLADIVQYFMGHPVAYLGGMPNAAGYAIGTCSFSYIDSQSRGSGLSLTYSTRMSVGTARTTSLQPGNPFMCQWQGGGTSSSSMVLMELAR